MPGGDEKKEESAESKEEAAEQVIIRCFFCSLKGTSPTIKFFYIILYFSGYLVNFVALPFGENLAQASSQICPHPFFEGSLTRDFRHQVFFINQCPPGP